MLCTTAADFKCNTPQGSSGVALRICGQAVLVSEFTVFGSMPDRKEAILKLLNYVQSFSEYKNIMQRVNSLKGRKHSYEHGEDIVLKFLGMGAEDYSYPISSKYRDELILIKKRLRVVASKGTIVVKNDTEEYQKQPNVIEGFQIATQTT